MVLYDAKKRKRQNQNMYIINGHLLDSSELRYITFMIPKKKATDIEPKI